MNIFDTFFYQPLLQLLLLIYDSIPGGLGVAVIVLTIVVKVLLIPLNNKVMKSQKEMMRLQPKLEELQKKYKGDQEQLGRETMKLYGEAGMNPFSGIILLLIQMPVLFAIYRVFQEVPKMEGINSMFLGMDLALPSIIITLIATALFFVQSRMTQTSGKGKSTMQKQMEYIFPFMMLIILIKIPAAISIYLTTSSIFSIIQTRIIVGKKEDDKEG